MSLFSPHLDDDARDELAAVALDLAKTEKDAFLMLVKSITPHWLWPYSPAMLNATDDVRRMIEQVLEPYGGVSLSDGNDDSDSSCGLRSNKSPGQE